MSLSIRVDQCQQLLMVLLKLRKVDPIIKTARGPN